MQVELNIQPLDGGFAGVPTYLRNLIGELTRLHSEIDLHYVADHPVDGVPAERQTILGPSVVSLKTKLLWENLYHPLHTLKKRPDIVHLPYHASTSWGAGRRIITVHDCFLWDHPLAKRAERINRGLLAHAAKRADAIITDSVFSQMRIERLFRIPAERIFVTPLACSPDIAVPRTATAIDRFRRQHDIGQRSIFYAGGTAAHKGIGSLISAYAQLDDDLRATTDLVIAGRLGDAPHHLEIKAAIAALPSPGRIILTGMIPQSDLGTAYQSASIFVFPSYYEGFGLSPLEAMQCGIPVVASNRTSVPEVVGDAGILIDPSDPAMIADALTSVLTDPAYEAELRQRSLNRATNFTWRQTADLTVSAYRALLS